MKKIILLATLLTCCLQCCIFFIQAQILYGTTFGGGNVNGGAGTINKFIPATNKLVIGKSFESLAAYPYGKLIQATNGKLYGMSSGGGSNNAGVIFSFDPAFSTYTTLIDFGGIKNHNGLYFSDGESPQGSLIQASDGKLYGMTIRGGLHGNGVIFSF